MKNLSLARKMLLLTLILITTTLLVAYVAWNRLSIVNGQVQHLVNRTIAKRDLLSTFHVKFLATIRAQKNSILNTEDEAAKSFAALSRTLMGEARKSLDQLKDLTTEDRVEGQGTTMDALSKAYDNFAKVNTETLELSVQNSNIKSKKILESDVARQVKILSEYFQRWLDEVLSMNDATPERSERLKSLYAINSALLDLYPETMKHIESSSKEQMDAQEQKIAVLQTSIQNGIPIASGGNLTSLIAPNAALSEIKSAYSNIIRLSRLDTTNRSIGLSLNESKIAGDETVNEIQALDKLLITEGTAGRDLSEATYHNALWWIGASTLGGLALGGLLATLVTRSITGPITQVCRLSQSMANGDLRERIHLESEDEVGQLSEATNSLADSLTKIVSQIQKVSASLGGSAGDLTGVSNQLISQSSIASSKATNVASASEELSTNISTMAAAAEEMSVNVASISSASEEMSINVGTISSAAEQTSTNVSVVSGAVEEISSSFADVLKDVREGSNVAGDASRMADSATETIQLLNRSGAEISKVTETIKMIALQTNLLALNATIEATSAGEAGKGFAVVAHEIKELANQSAKAAEDIARKIEGVQNNTRQAVDVIQNVSQIIKDINASSVRISTSVEKQTRAASMISQNVGEANKGVGDIARSIAEVAKAAGDMSRNVAEAAHGATNVSRNVAEAAKAAGAISSDIHGVSDASRATNSSASMVNESAEQLDQIGKELRQLVSRFKLSTEVATNA